MINIRKLEAELWESADLLRKEGNELVSVTNQLKLRAADGKRYDTDVQD